MMGKMVSKGWGLQPDIIKIWHRTAVEQALTCSAPIWGHNLNKQSETRLRCQRYFDLAIDRAFRTAQTATLVDLL